MGGDEGFLPGELEPSLRDHSGRARVLMVFFETRHQTVSGGQFSWGGNLNSGRLKDDRNYDRNFSHGILMLQPREAPVCPRAPGVARQAVAFTGRYK